MPPPQTNKHGTGVKTTMDDFAILSRLSRGAYGRVFLASKNSSGDLYAIKIMSKKAAVKSHNTGRIKTGLRHYFILGFLKKLNLVLCLCVGALFTSVFVY